MNLLLVGLGALALALECVVLSVRVGKLRAALAHRDAIIDNRDAEIARLRKRLGFEAES